MADSPESTARIRYLLTSLVVILIFILALLVLLAAYPVVLAPSPAITPTITPIPTNTHTATLILTITPTPEPTRTSRPTFTPTITLIPSHTPTPSLTPTYSGPPTLTPASAVRGKDYSLEEWSPELADYMVMLMDDYPNTLSEDKRGENDEGYYVAFYYATIAQKEALLRYPDVPQAVFWRWGLAYNLAQVGDPQAGEAYAEIITLNLNEGDVDFKELETWFEFQEDRLTLEITELKPVPGYISSNLIEVKGGGSAFLLLLETNSGFQSYVLRSNFDFVNDPQFGSFAEDLTGNGIEEVVIYPIKPLEKHTLNPPLVYSLSQIPPLELDFNQATTNFEVGMEFTSQWSAESEAQGQTLLSFETNLFPPCIVALSRTYFWNDLLFDLTDTQFQVQPDPDTLTYCNFMVDHAANTWGPEAAIQIMEPILPDWPPEVDENGDPYPLDAHDEWRYRLGVYHALLGHYEEATNYFNEIITDPITPDSQWIAPAEDFLATYKKPDDVYKACLNAEFCDPRHALSYLVENIPLDDYSDALTYLGLAGVKTRASGDFDFDGDGLDETWLTIRHHELQKLEFWILSPYPEGIEPIFVSVVESSRPTLIYIGEDSDPPIVLLDGTIVFSIHRVPGSSQPYLVNPDLPDTYPNRFEDGLHDATTALFSGVDPAIVKIDLIILESNPGLLCEPYWSCDPYYYMLGLASELSGDEKVSVDSYVFLWWNYPRSPFTIMARLKLEGATLPPFPTPTYTVTPTVTSTLTPTRTSTP
ncbi:MAG: hypothetical protein KAS38_04430, partial [Anaerolineales bacterium]|nr:hypothetical protein [Anaerolineales bacterium]